MIAVNYITYNSTTAVKHVTYGLFDKHFGRVSIKGPNSLN